jgi:D-glycero-alpha-D-manno-heptose 1-phosphate guanylyltransferase
MEAIVLAGGLGTRLREVLPDLPKPMAPVAGRPFLEILLRSLVNKGFERAILSLGFMAEKISRYFGDQFEGMQLSYVVEDHPLGTGGAVRLALSSCQLDHAFIFNGDTFLDLEVDAVERLWHDFHHPIIVGRSVQNTARYGRLLMAEGRVTGFSEKGMTGQGLINAGCYVLNRGQLDHFELNEVFSLETDFLARAVHQMPVEIFLTEGLFIDIGIPSDYALAQTLLAEIAR